MKIVDAKPPVSKAEKIRKMAKKICDKDVSIISPDLSSYRYAVKVIMAMGLKPKTRKLPKGGWQIWVSSK